MIATGNPTDASGVSLPDAADTPGFLSHPASYGEPIFRDVSVPASQWTRISTRDIQRSALIVFRAVVTTNLLVRSGTNPVACPFVLGDSQTVLTLLYADFLTVVTGEFFAWSALGEVITVGTVRLL